MGSVVSRNVASFESLPGDMHLPKSNSVVGQLLRVYFETFWCRFHGARTVGWLERTREIGWEEYAYRAPSQHIKPSTWQREGIGDQKGIRRDDCLKMAVTASGGTVGRSGQALASSQHGLDGSPSLRCGPRETSEVRTYTLFTTCRNAEFAVSTWFALLPCPDGSRNIWPHDLDFSMDRLRARPYSQLYEHHRLPSIYFFPFNSSVRHVGATMPG